MNKEQHYETIARIIGNEMALGVNLVPEDDEHWQMQLRSVAQQLASYFAQDPEFDKDRFLQLCRAALVKGPV